jgi:aryl-alcohol dehydrogenase-like predicted oxidoreductase
MRYARLGRTDLTVRRALELGITFLDTSPFCGS